MRTGVSCALLYVRAVLARRRLLLQVAGGGGQGRRSPRAAAFPMPRMVNMRHDSIR